MLAFSFCPGPQTFKDYAEQTYSSYRTLLTHMHKLCLDSLWMRKPLSLQHLLPSKQQIVVNFWEIWAKITIKKQKNLNIHL